MDWTTSLKKYTVQKLPVAIRFIILFLECARNSALWPTSVILIALHWQHSISLVFSYSSLTCITDVNSFNIEIQNVIHIILFTFTVSGLNCFDS